MAGVASSSSAIADDGGDTSGNHQNINVGDYLCRHVYLGSDACRNDVGDCGGRGNRIILR